MKDTGITLTLQHAVTSVGHDLGSVQEPQPLQEDSNYTDFDKIQ